MDSTPSAPVIIEEVAPTTSSRQKRARTDSFRETPEPRKISRTEEPALPDLFVGHLSLPADWQNPEPWAGNVQTYRTTIEDETEHRLEEDHEQWYGEHSGYQGQGAGEAVGGHPVGLGGGENRREHGPGGDGHGRLDQGGMAGAREPDSDSDDVPTPIHLMDNSALTDAEIVQAITILYRVEVIEANADLAGLVVGKKEMKAKVKLYLLPKIVEQLSRPDINVSE